MQNTKTKFQVRLDSGIFKGKVFALPSSDTTRSTKALVRNSLFNSIRDDLKGKIFIEMFGGSGLMAGLALGNGAKKAFCIEKDKNAFNIMQKNISSLNSNDIEAIFGDTLIKTPELSNKFKDQKQIIYIDPPFDIRDGFSGIYERIWKCLEKIDKNNIYFVIFEHISSYETPQNSAGFTKIKTRKFGKTTLSYYKVED